jgi:MoxR-like ATPase
MDGMSQKLEQVQAEVNKVIKGKEDVVKKVLAAVIAGGHILMEDIPGVGKTTLATTFAKSMSMHYKRVQFTPDVLPSDILGFSMYNSATKEFEYREGAVFTNLFLADEINRTSPKTQSALLEVMEEKTATVDGVTRPLPDPFVVIATENPWEKHWVFSLSEIRYVRRERNSSTRESRPLHRNISADWFTWIR